MENLDMRNGIMIAALGLATGIGSAGVDTTSNAALAYYRAWAGMDQGTQSVLQIEGDGVELADGGSELLAKSGGTIEALLDASLMGTADWDIAYEDGPFASLPHLGKMRTASKILAADALRCAQDGQQADAAVRVAALYRMSGQVSGDRVLISSLVGMAIDNLANNLTTQLIDEHQLDAPGAKLVHTTIQERGIEDRFAMRDAIVGEWRMISEYILAHLPEIDPGTWVVEQMNVATDAPPSKMIASMNRSQILLDLGGFSAYYGDVISAWDADDGDALEAAESKVQSGEYGPLTELLGATMTRAFASHQEFIDQTQSVLELLEQVND